MDTNDHARNYINVDDDIQINTARIRLINKSSTSIKSAIETLNDQGILVDENDTMFNELTFREKRCHIAICVGKQLPTS